MADGNEARMALHKAHIEGQSKYTYFLLAAAGAAIAFAVTQTQTATLTWSKVPLGLSVLCWGLSFYMGCGFLWNAGNLIQQNYQMLRTQAGLHPQFPARPEVIAMMENSIEEQSSKSGRDGTWQFRFLIAGAIFYILWHVLEMYLRTTPLKLP